MEKLRYHLTVEMPHFTTNPPDHEENGPERVTLYVTIFRIQTKISEGQFARLRAGGVFRGESPVEISHYAQVLGGAAGCAT